MNCGDDADLECALETCRPTTSEDLVEIHAAGGHHVRLSQNIVNEVIGGCSCCGCSFICGFDDGSLSSSFFDKRGIELSTIGANFDRSCSAPWRGRLERVCRRGHWPGLPDGGALFSWQTAAHWNERWDTFATGFDRPSNWCFRDELRELL